MSDSERWQRFTFRPDDIVITTPSKCGTTWMQNIVGALVFGTSEFPGALSEVSPWLDRLTMTDDEVFARLDAQQHRRFIKTHIPLDGLPMVDDVTYLTIVRHPLDVALSDRDHDHNADVVRSIELREAAVGKPDDDLPRTVWPDDDSPRGRLMWFIDNDNPPTGAGPNGLADYCNQVRSYWTQRHRPNVHLFHYQQLWDDLPGQIQRLADVLGVSISAAAAERLSGEMTLDALRARASDTAPEAHQGIWVDPAKFFRQGGRRDWATHLDAADMAHFHERLDELAGDAASWLLGEQVP